MLTLAWISCRTPTGAAELHPDISLRPPLPAFYSFAGFKLPVLRCPTCDKASCGIRTHDLPLTERVGARQGCASHADSPTRCTDRTQTGLGRDGEWLDSCWAVWHSGWGASIHQSILFPLFLFLCLSTYPSFYLSTHPYLCISLIYHNLPYPILSYPIQSIYLSIYLNLI